MIRLYLVFTLFSCSLAFGQTGPGGVGTANGSSTLNGWWRADKGVTLSGGAVSNWADQSGYAHDLEQSNTFNQPTSGVSVALNNQSAVKYDGALNQFLGSTSFTGPGTNNATVFFAANGSNYQLLLFFFDSGSSYFIFPGPSPNSELIISSDGDFGNPLNSGLTAGVNNVSAARYRRNTINGMQTYLNGAAFAQRNSADAALPSGNLFSGYVGTCPTADVGEMIVYLSALNDAQMVIVQNYLAAKYNTTLSSNDVYAMDDAANGDYDNDVAGIGQTDASNMHNDSRGTGILRILNPSDLENGEFFMWGSDNGATQATNTTDVPSGVTARFARVWRVSETGGDGDVGSIDVQIDVTGLADFSSLSACDAALSLQLLVDTDNDGVFADQTPITGATSLGNNVYRFANVTALANNRRFTFGLVSSAVDGPGGVGGTNGATSLQLWLTASKGLTTSGSNVISWADQAGTGRIATAPGTTARPLVIPNSVNGQPRISFDGTTDILELNTNINTTTPTMFTVMNKGSAGVTSRIFLSLQNNQWFGRSAGTNQWGMFNNTDVLSGTTVNNLAFFLLTSVERNYDDVDLSTNGTATTLTNGTGFSGTSLGSIGASNSGSSGTGLSFFQGNLAEVLLYTSNLNSAQRLIVENALAAKYALTISGDVYAMDNPANGNFDFDVAGIARVNASNQHTDAKGQGLVRISGATDLGDNESFLWGHNNTALTVRSTDVPSGVQSRLAREWGVSETGDVGAVNMQLDLSGLYGSITPSDLRLLIDHDGDGIYNEAGTQSISGATATSCGYYTFTGVTALDNAMRFTLGTINFSQTPLPIELVRFEGEAQATSVRLAWETESEINNDYFTVERSVTGTDFTAVGKLDGAGTSKEHHSYELLDEISFTGTVYYRLKQTDFDGAVSYSDVIRVKGVSDESVSIYPNPQKAGGDIHVKISEGYSDAGTCNISVIDRIGRQVLLQPALIGSGEIIISGSGQLAAGVYLLKIDFPNAKSLVRKISVVK
ncbi:MAG: T9SS type A sorting domain-containing protein [Cyclobacteriaceae bacterium]